MLYRGQCSTLKGPADVSQWQHWTVRSLFHGIPHSGWDERGQRIQHSSRGCSPQSTGQSRGIQGLWERPGGLSPHLDHGEDGHFTPNSSYGESPKIPLGQLFKCSWERLHWPRVFSWQGCTQKPELNCSDSLWTMEMADYQWPGSFVQGARICLIPGVTQSLMTELCLRPGWSATGKFGGLGENPERSLSLSCLSLQKMQFLNLSKQEGDQYSAIERFNLSLAEIETPTLLQIYSGIHSGHLVLELSFCPTAQFLYYS